MEFWKQIKCQVTELEFQGQQEQQYSMYLALQYSHSPMQNSHGRAYRKIRGCFLVEIMKKDFKLSPSFHKETDYSFCCFSRLRTRYGRNPFSG